MAPRLGWVRLAAGAALVAVAAPAAGAPVNPDDVALATDAGEAQVIEAGVYDSRVPAIGELGYVAVSRTLSGSTLWVGQSVPVQNGRYGTLQVKAHAADDVDDQICQTQTAMAREYNGDTLVTGLMMIDSDKCGADADLVLSTTNDKYAGTPLAAGAAFRMALWEEPPAREPSLLPPPATTVDWAGKVQPARGRQTLGTTFADAPELVDGRWEVHVTPRQPGLFRVPLEWGEHVEVGMLYQGPEREEYVPIEAMLLTPLGGEAAWAEAEDAPVFDSVSLSYPGSQSGVASPSIAWRNREAGTENHAAFPGVYYVNIGIRPEDAPPQGVDITVSVQVVQDREIASPYAEDGLPAPDLGEHGAFAAALAVVEDEERDASTGDSSTDDAPPWSLVAALFGGFAVMAVVGGAALRRSRGSPSISR